MHAFESELDYVYTLLRCFGAGRPTRVVFQFPKRIEESEYRLLIGREGRFERLALPVGESIRLGRDAR